MKYLLYALVAVPAALLLLYTGVFSGSGPESSDDRQAEQGRWETKTDNTPPVTIEATPIELGPNAKTWKFNLKFTTHSGGLDEDPAKVSLLSDEKGGTHRPTAWKGPGPGGHHREGVLVFKAIAFPPSAIELKIDKVGGVERSFQWDLE